MHITAEFKPPGFLFVLIILLYIAHMMDSLPCFIYSFKSFYLHQLVNETIQIQNLYCKNL